MEDILFNKNFTCVAVSKTKPKEDIEKIYNLGHRDFGENKVQELEYKYNNLPQDINWHMIGHLQSNKVRKVIPIVSLIHSVDSLKLLKVINKESKKFDKVTNCLIQVNISKESSKYGFKESELGFLNQESMSEYQNIKFKGLMGMASFTDSESIIKNEFNIHTSLYRFLYHSFNIITSSIFGFIFFIMIWFYFSIFHHT